MSDHEALARIPDTINIGQLASLQMKNASPDPDSYVQKLNDDYWNKKYDFGQGASGASQLSSPPDQGAQIQPTKTISPGLLEKMDQDKNQDWWKGQRLATTAGDSAAQAASNPASTSAPVANQSMGERARTPAYDEEIRKGEEVADRVRRGIERANTALGQTVEGQQEKWAYNPGFFSRSYWKCNEFSCYAHESGDPQGYKYPKIGGFNFFNHKPTVDMLANPEYAKDVLETHQGPNLPWPGDILVWYDPVTKTHHSGIALGNGRVAYASEFGAKVNTIEDTTRLLSGTPPIIRRFK